MRRLLDRPLQAIGGSALLLGLISLFATPAISQQPATNANLCSTATQSCSDAILSDGPLSVSTESSQLDVGGTRALTLEQISNLLNEQADLEESSTQLGIGPVNINSGDRDSLGVRDNVRD